MSNINTKHYWDDRFASGDWENKSGRNQTQEFAKSQIRYLEIPENFSGTILDFGCGLGDAIPIFKEAFPKAKFIGMDISEAAIKKCKESYGDIAEFICGTYLEVPLVDVIIASNVFEHLSNDMEIAQNLIKKCTTLYIIVPYKEILKENNEHVNTYDEKSFRDLANCNYKVFASRGWSQFGWNLVYQIYFKNIIRPFFGMQRIKRAKQIMFILRK